MATISQIRGALLEEAVLHLLKLIGYQIVKTPTKPTKELRRGKAGLDVRGRGTWHQLDALVTLVPSPAFIYPMRLIVEAKCYADPVELEVVRNAVGVRVDISQNFITVPRSTARGLRYNYHAAVFSASGFTAGAIDYAIAHQVYLIPYRNVPAIAPLIASIVQFDADCLTPAGRDHLAALRALYRAALGIGRLGSRGGMFLTSQGRDLMEQGLVHSAMAIQGSYFGMLQGRWPLHLLSRLSLLPRAFPTDEVSCSVTGYLDGRWGFEPIGYREGQAGWFRLEFDLPEQVARVVAANWGDSFAVAQIKQRMYSYIDLSGMIGGIRRTVRLTLDREWIKAYLRRPQPSRQFGLRDVPPPDEVDG